MLRYIVKARIEGTFEPEKAVVMRAIADMPNKQEMAYVFRGQQPVVAMKWSNVHRAKGHSHLEQIDVINTTYKYYWKHYLYGGINMSIKFNEIIKNEAIQSYLNGKPASHVAGEIEANEVTVRKLLKDAGIEIRNGAVYSQKHDDGLVKKIIELYKRGLNTTEIQEILGLKRGIASYLLRKNDYKLRHKGPKSLIGKENYFDIIDTEAKAYFLGWIMADGNVSIYNGQYSLKIHIALVDREIIDKFLEAIDSKNKASVKSGKNPSYYVSLTSVHMCNRLIELGVIPCKSGREKFPDQVPANLYSHFIRGIFDGDGITDIGGRSGFVGSREMLERILKILCETNRKLYPNRKNENIYYFLGGKKFSRRLFEFMYRDANIWLQRKRTRMEIICSK